MELQPLLQDSLPESFEFYHLGAVRPSETPRSAENQLHLDADALAIAFQVQGDFNGVILTVFDDAADESMYTEMGNLLASRFATRLSQQHGIDVMISAPTRLEHGRVLKLLKSSSVLLSQTYEHVGVGPNVTAEMLVLGGKKNV